MLKEIRNPDIFHGFNKDRNFFEGWYFKIVDTDSSNMYAFIPGIFLGSDNKTSHSFIQIISSECNKNYYLKFEKEAFCASKDRFLVNI